MSDSVFLEAFSNAYSQMLADYTGGLSNTSTSKFIEINSVFRDRLKLEDEKAVYSIGAGTRPGNIEVRLNQGLRATMHTNLGIAFIKPDDPSQVQDKSDSAVTTILTFLNRGKGKYDSILVVAEVDSQPVPTRLVTYSDSPVLGDLEEIFDGLNGFEVCPLERTQDSQDFESTLSKMAAGDIEIWKIPDLPKSDPGQFPIQRLIEGCPGSGKSYRLDQDSLFADRVIRTIFHPEFGFADFVGYLSPETAFKIEDPGPVFKPALPGTPFVFYSFCCGPLLEAYIFAVLNPEHRIILIVEELSRAPASLVFGDTLQLLDRVEDGETGPGLPPAGFSRYEIRPKGEVKRLLESLEAYSPHTQPGCMRFPSNLSIWATMNRADQNAKQLDTAFLRRWRREHISHDVPGSYDESTLNCLGREVAWGDFRKAVNETLVSSGATEDKLVGAYFLTEKALSIPEQVADDLLAYIWYDVLREDGLDVFPQVRTFADIRRKWIDGQLEFPPGLKENE